MRPTFYILKSPGSKCWLFPNIEKFLGELKPKTICETYAGSGVSSLRLLNRGYTKRVVLAEKDERLRMFWTVALTDPDFSRRVNVWAHRLFTLPLQGQWDFVEESLEKFEVSDPAFWALLKSRTSFKGILRSGVARSDKRGPNFPSTLTLSLKFLYERRPQIEVLSDVYDALRYADSADTYGFIDPPYTLTEGSPGHSHYKESDVDYKTLLLTLKRWKGYWQLTSEACTEMVTLLGITFSGRADVDWNLVSGRTGLAEGELLVSRKPGRTVESSRSCGKAGLARLQEILNRQACSRVSTSTRIEQSQKASNNCHFEKQRISNA
jgi:site-specific DNA-adenine methylase